MSTRFDESDLSREPIWRAALKAEGFTVSRVSWMLLCEFARSDGWRGYLERQGLDPETVVEVHFKLDVSGSHDPSLAMLLAAKPFRRSPEVVW